MQHPFLQDLITVYAFGVVIVYFFRRLNQSAMAGFLITGVLIGPHGLGLVSSVHSVEVLAEAGIMLLLFSVGIEFSLRKFSQMRTVFWRAAPLQVLSHVAVVSLLASYAGINIGLGILLGLLVALSSTAVVLRLFVERGESDSLHGRITLGILIFQDFCIVPGILLLPMLGSQQLGWMPLFLALAKAVAIIVGVLFAARYFFPRLLHQITLTQSRELFVITCILMFLGTAWLTSRAGLSLALGSFLAGLILSESEYSHQIFAEIRPLRDSLNSLFFISVGMLVNPSFVWPNLWMLAGLIVLLVVSKGALSAGAVLASGFPLQTALLAGLPLAQIGEFSFVLLNEATELGMVPADWYQIILSCAIITMILSPALMSLSRRLLSMSMVSRVAGSLAVRSGHGQEPSEIIRDHVLICGFGASGRNIARVLKENAIPYLILELNPQLVRESRSNNEPILYGDCTEPLILEHVGVRYARAMVLAVSDPFSTGRAVSAARSLNREVPILVRTKYLSEIDALYNLGASEVVAEEFEASIELLTRILRLYHVPRARVAEEIKNIRDQRYEIFRERRLTVPRLRLSSELEIYTETFEVPPDSGVRGRRVAEIGLHERAGTLILGIIRSRETLSNPGPNDTIHTGDRLVLSGTKEQLDRARQILECS
ncbi:MAG: cation:proton antiporter [Acidobacteria bacterium]|nr:cation:proton antiporter [Acidobacteriota bacterium]